MSNEVDVDRSRFIKFFNDHLEVLPSLEHACAKNEVVADIKIYQKLIYMSILGALSRTIGLPGNDREKFVFLLENFSEWPYCEKVSLPHLVRLLERNCEPALQDLREFVFSLWERWDDGIVIGVDEDIDFTEIEKRWPQNVSKLKLRGKDSIEALTHVQLIYHYRNSLVHEIREAGRGIEFNDDDDPFYHSWVGEQKIWSLVYPVHFFHKICKVILNNLKKYYFENDINPYDFFDFGEYIKPDLNT